MSLLDKAKGIKHSSILKQITPDVVELSLAWVKGEIGLVQVRKAMEEEFDRKFGMSVYIDLARSIRQAYAEGKIIVKEKKK